MQNQSPTTLLAGKEGFSIQVKQRTQLNGAWIKSDAEEHTNQLSTGTLAFNDRLNTQHRRFKPQTLSLSFATPSALLQGGVNTLLANGVNQLLAQQESKQASFLIPAAISPAQINIQHPNQQQQSLALLNRTFFPVPSMPDPAANKQQAIDKAKLLESIVTKSTLLATKK